MSGVVLNLNSDSTFDAIQDYMHESRYKYIHFDHSATASESRNIIELASKNEDFKRKLVLLTNSGFLTYVLRGGVSSLVHYSEINKLWNPVKEGQYLCNSDGVVYEFKDAEVQSNKKLLVVFSQIPLEPYSASLNRYFAKNFSTIDKYVGKNVAILRIADLGGITGAFYLNTIALPNNEKNIQSLISKIANENHINQDGIVLYGTSKGGTAAVYHGLYCGYRTVAVDPILDDDYYYSKLNDLHMIDGVFPVKKIELFSKAFKDFSYNVGKLSLIVSQNSEQYSYINKIVAPYVKELMLLNSVNPNIKNHPEVGPNSLHAITALINMALIGVNFEKNFVNFV